MHRRRRAGARQRATTRRGRMDALLGMLTTRRRSRSGCRTWPRSRVRSRRYTRPPGLRGCSAEDIVQDAFPPA
jgi:hypothetical protein